MRRPSVSQPAMNSRHHQFLDVSLANTAAGFSSSLTTTLLLQQPQPSVPAARRGEANTRVQLQKQRLEEQHAVDFVSKSIPGLKTSAAFFASLRTNLRLHNSPPPSPLPTPSPSLASSWTTLPPPSPLSIPLTPTDSVMDPLDTPSKPPRTSQIPKITIPPPSPLISTDPLAGLPELTTYPTTSSPEKVSALKLIADSVAQQRQIANRTLIFHPIHLTCLIALLAFVLRTLSDRGYDYVGLVMTCSGVLMGYLLFIRFSTQGYLSAAEGIGWGWLGEDGDGGSVSPPGVVSELFVTRFGEEVIGCAVVEWVSAESCKQRRKRAWRGEIRAWTVRLRYRGKGVGTALLEEVVKEGKRRGAEGIEFADDHANSVRVLPRFYNGVFDRREWRAREALFDLLQSSPRGKRK